MDQNAACHPLSCTLLQSQDHTSATIDILDLTGTEIAHFHAKRTFESVKTIISDQRGFCCLSVIISQCILHMKCIGHAQRCKPYLKTAEQLYLAVVVVAIYLFNLSTIPYCFRRCANVSYDVTGHILIANCLFTLPLIQVSKWNIEAGTEYSFMESSITQGTMSTIVSYSLITSFELTATFGLLLSVLKYYGMCSLHINALDGLRGLTYGFLCALWAHKKHCNL